MKKCDCSHTQALIVKEITLRVEEKIDSLADALGFYYDDKVIRGYFKKETK